MALTGSVATSAAAHREVIRAKALLLAADGLAARLSSLKFLRTIDRQVPKGLQIHMILDNYGTHTHDRVVAWLDKHPRFHLHFIPTSSSWLNMVERWFRELTEKAIRCGVFTSVPDLVAAIEAYLQANNNDPKSFVWTATAEEILEKVSRGRVRSLGAVPSMCPA